MFNVKEKKKKNKQPEEKTHTLKKTKLCSPLSVHPDHCADRKADVSVAANKTEKRKLFFFFASMTAMTRGIMFSGCPSCSHEENISRTAGGDISKFVHFD